MLPEYSDAGRIGLYSAGLNSRDTDHDILIGGVQSIYKRANKLGRRHLTLVDEAHLIPASGDGMYRQLITDLKLVYRKSRLVGLTATPYRMTSGVIYGEGQPFEKVIHNVDVKDLIADGYLSPLVGCAESTPDLDGLHLRGGEYISNELNEVYNNNDIVSRACQDLMTKARDRHHWLVFCVTIAHAESVCEKLQMSGINAACITSETKKVERATIIKDYKAGKIRALINVGVLTTGFDAPMVDCVAMMRATKSPGLYSQILGRGFRLHDTKKDCLILDFGNNIREHGPVDSIKPPSAQGSRGEAKKKDPDEDKPKGKICPNCEKILEYKDLVCVACGYEYPANHESLADTRVSPLSNAVLEDWDIIGVQADHWVKKGVPASEKHKFPDTLMIEWIATEGSVKEWVCVGHGDVSPYARSKAVKWWDKLMQGIECPNTAEEAAKVFHEKLKTSEFEIPMSMQILVGGKWPELKKLNFIEKSHNCKECVRYSDVSGHCDHWNDKVPEYRVSIGCEQFDGVPF